MRLLGGMILLLAGVSVLAGPEPTAEQRRELGQTAYERGDLTAAIAHWRGAEQAFARQRNSRARIQVLVSLGAIHQSLGQQRLALQALEEASRLADGTPGQPTLLLARNGLGVVCGCLNQYQRATTILREAIQSAKSAGQTGMVAVLGNSLGNLLAAQNKTDDALAALLEAAQLARTQSVPLLAGKAFANAGAVAAHAGRLEAASQHNQSAYAELRRLPASAEQALLYLRCGQTEWRCRQTELAGQAYEHARTIATGLDDKRLLSFALGYLGELKLAAGDFNAALELTRRAAFLAQEVQAADVLYRWEWQTGRIHRAQGNHAAAIAAYRRAIESLRPIRQDLLYGQDLAGTTFREMVVPLFYELTDLLLRQPDSTGSLRAACDTLEELRSLEVEDYLQDECMVLVRAQSARIENIGSKTAVLYIIPLPDRTELLVGLQGKLQRVTVPVTAERLAAEVRSFRAGLQKRTTNQYRASARQLYAWLITPLRRMLDEAGTDTLVFVPDGSLRTVPLTALLDGDKFLVEQYAVAVTPGLTLLSPRPMPRKQVQVLVAGLSEAVQNHAPLPNVPTEIAAVQRAFGGLVRLDRQFVWSAVKKDFADNQYQIVHFATHGRITPDASESYLLTHDARLSLDQLESLIRPSQFRGRPVELLTLSACDTAAGDDRAALGLAGLALKAGARSALATLWSVHDESTALLLGDFYAQLAGQADLSKAQAMQRAQIKILRDERFQHPGYWAPYLLIGNWL